MRLSILGWIVAALIVAAPAAMAERLAVVIANSQYRALPQKQQHDTVLQLAPKLRAAGFRTVELRNLTSNTALSRLQSVGQQIEAAEQVVVVLSGHFASLENRSYLLTIDAAGLSSFNLGRYGVPVDAFVNLLRSKQGAAMLALSATVPNPDVGWRLGKGYRLGTVPQGVTMLAGKPHEVTNFLPELLVPGRPMGATADLAPDGMQVLGFLPQTIAFLPPAGPAVPPPGLENAVWQQALATNTVAAYEAYLQRYPNGLFANQARARIQELSLTPQDRARLAEEALGLSKQRRTRLQQYLTILGFDTRGVDGVFGRRTRTAIANWQATIGAPSTGYLTANQVARIEQAGAVRAEELRQQAERLRLEQEARDRAFWQGTGASGSEQGLLAYLQQYPNGLFSDDARAKLKAIEREKRRQARVEERLAWDAAVLTGTIDSYRAYLNTYPNGMFSAEAKARIQALSGPNIPPHIIQQAKAEEDALRLDPFRKQLIERQLDRLGLKPGPVDGTFTPETRRALAQYQQGTNQPVTGYVTADLMVMLLVSALGR